MSLASAAEKQEQGLDSPYAAFSTFYTGIMTVPASHDEMLGGQYNDLLASHVNKYYQFKSQYTQKAITRTPAPEPGPAPQRQEQPSFAPLFIGGLAVIGTIFFLARRPPT
jgi:hypothetical protein